MDLTDEQWEFVRSLIPRPSGRADGRGRPRVENRKILDGILWIMRTGAPWHDLPDKYPSISDLPSSFSALEGCWGV